MKFINIPLLFLAALLVGCGGDTAENNGTTSNGQANTVAGPRLEIKPAVADRPQGIKDQMAARGEQDSASPTLKIVEPKANAALTSSTVKVKLELAGDLKGYQTHQDPATKMGNHIHVILDNQPYEAYYDLGREFELRNVSDGEHTLRVFPSRPWHESYKNEGAFQMVKFKVTNGGGDPSKPATANGQQMSNTANPGSTPEGKDMSPSTAGPVDPAKPLLTYSRPKGEYLAADAANGVMIDFWLSNAKLTGDGGTYRIRYKINGTETNFLDKWQPVWLTGLAPGSYVVQLELVDSNSALVDNGGYNSTTRKITIK